MSFSAAITFRELPIWKGTSPDQRAVDTAPFVLGWDSAGFIRQDLNANDHSARAYADDDYAFITPPPGMSDWATRFGQQHLDYIAARVPSVSGKNILDIGGGSTFVTESLTTGVEAASMAVIVDPALRAGTNSAKVRIVRDYFPSKDVHDEFDLIISCNCLEHVPDPAGFLTAVRSAALARDADVILVFPDTEAQFATGDLNVLLHEHISCFTKATAESLFRSVGLDVRHHQSLEDCHFYHLRAASPAAADVQQEPILARGSALFQASIDFAERQIRSELDRGLKVAFHGATNGLNNTLFLAGLSHHPNVFVFDGDDSKAGRFLPTAVHPIRYSADPSYLQMDRVYVSALTFYSAIFSFLTMRQGIQASRIAPISPNFG